MSPLPLIFVLIGLFSICGGLLDWNWFMEQHKARWLVRLLGRLGARIFYIALGLALVVLGGLGAAGVVDIDR